MPFRGFLYAGLMMTQEGPKVLEFNCRMGDPEAQVLLDRLDCDAGELFLAAATGGLANAELRFDPRPAVCVVLASGGYPGSYQTGAHIEGLEAVSACEEVLVFHAGTEFRDGGVVTTGGRVLTVVARGGSMPEAIDRAYAAESRITFVDKQVRTDIGRRVAEADL